MRKHHAGFLFLAVLCLTMLFVGCRKGVPVQPVSHVAVPQTRAGLTAQDVEDAIIRGGASRGWSVSKRSPGEMQATLHVRGKHTVVVSVPYTKDEFSINYVSSSGLNTRDGNVHPNVNNWIENLRRSIYRELAIK